MRLVLSFKHAKNKFLHTRNPPIRIPSIILWRSGSIKIINYLNILLLLYELDDYLTNIPTWFRFCTNCKCNKYQNKGRKKFHFCLIIK